MPRQLHRTPPLTFDHKLNAWVHTSPGLSVLVKPTPCGGFFDATTNGIPAGRFARFEEVQTLVENLVRDATRARQARVAAENERQGSLF